ncbi:MULTISPECIES: hypothetical protein [unclassified Aureispira]|uniref:hypothetical protein n=1 Tax=unclassified Aureispira TaxID=2649989 RepID=UPI00069699EB|nr:MULTISPECIES: hypothetical protein [unclassified Aureispira]WMX12071.1 hypothetical protein QP953_14685 [Aureispira sp. CCB-E]
MKELILLLRNVGVEKLLLTKAIPLSIALLLTETFVKLGSFTFEFFAFALLFWGLSTIGSLFIKTP